LCLTGSGNNNENRAKAEAALRELKQIKGEDGFLEYVRDFRSSILNLKNCKSSLSDIELVTYFVKGLDQSRNGHCDWYMHYLDKYTLLHSDLKDKSIDVVISLAEHHFNAVTRLVRNTSNAKGARDNTKSSASSEIALFTDVSNNNKRGLPNNSNGSNSERNPKKGKPEGKREYSADQLAKFKLIICRNFAEKGTCSYGNDCRYSHKKAKADSKKETPKKNNTAASA